MIESMEDLEEGMRFEFPEGKNIHWDGSDYEWVELENMRDQTFHLKYKIRGKRASVWMLVSAKFLWAELQHYDWS